MKIAIFDSSTLILLAKINLVKKVHDYAKILISEGVYEETVTKGKINNRLDALIIEKEVEKGNIQIRKIQNKKFIKQLLLDFKFSIGEAESIVLALQEKAFVFTDDKEAIKACKVYNIQFVTALALLIKMFRDKKISKEDASIKLEQLKNIGYYSKEIINQAIKELENGTNN